jgi:hypothetical protein
MDALLPTGPLPPRARIGILVLLLGSLGSSARLAWDAPRPRDWRGDDIAARSDQRFAGLKALLPKQGVIGYLGEAGNAGTADYYLAQYALAPLILDRSAKHSLVIASFPDAPPEIPSHFRLIRNLGHGVLLVSAEGEK